MITFFSMSAGVLSTLFVALVVAIQMFNFHEYMEIPAKIKRWFPWLMGYVGAAILWSVLMVLFSDLGTPLKEWWVWGGSFAVLSATTVLVAAVPFFKTWIEGELRLVEARAENQRLENMLAQLFSLIEGTGSDPTNKPAE